MHVMLSRVEHKNSFITSAPSLKNFELTKYNCLTSPNTHALATAFTFLIRGGLPHICALLNRLNSTMSSVF